MDAARGVALLGMFAAHTIYLPTEQLYDGRSAILFATLAGVSLALMTGGPTPPAAIADRRAARLTVLIRGCALILIGSLLALAQPPLAVILDSYGFAFLLLIPVLLVRPAVAAGLAVAVAVVGPAVVGALTAGADPSGLPAPVRLFADWLAFGPYPVLVWTAFVLGGLALGRSRLTRRPTTLAALVGGTLLAVGGYTAAFAPGITAAAHSGTTAEVVGSGGVALAVIGGFSLLDGATGAGEKVARVVRRVLSPLAAAGSMPLTIYTAHAIALAVIRAVTIDGPRWEPPGWVLPVLVVGALVFAALWRRFVGPGPLEALLRLVTRAAVRPSAAGEYPVPDEPPAPRLTP